MNVPFPGMDPYLEHPVLWESVHARLVVAIANQLQPLLDPRYVATIEKRVFIAGPQQRIPDIWIQKESGGGEQKTLTDSPSGSDAAVIVEVEELEIHQRRVEVLDSYNGMKLVSLIEVLSPTNKRNGPGRESYISKQQEILHRDCHLIEVDLLRKGQRTLSLPAWKLEQLPHFDYIVCVNRWPRRSRFELYPRCLEEQLPRIQIPLADSDPDVPLDIQDAVHQVHHEGRYHRRLRYDQPCDPPLTATQQEWANRVLVDFKGG